MDQKNRHSGLVMSLFFVCFFFFFYNKHWHVVSSVRGKMNCAWLLYRDQLALNDMRSWKKIINCCGVFSKDNDKKQEKKRTQQNHKQIPHGKQDLTTNSFLTCFYLLDIRTRLTVYKCESLHGQPDGEVTHTVTWQQIPRMCVGFLWVLRLPPSVQRGF